MNLAAVASGHVDGGRTAAKATQRDRMREMIERKGGKLPVAEREQGEAPVVVVDLAEIAQREKDDMNGYHGLSVDDASGLKMFCASARRPCHLNPSMPTRALPG
jgi:hypothetical protein